MDGQEDGVGVGEWGGDEGREGWGDGRAGGLAVVKEERSDGLSASIVD